MAQTAGLMILAFLLIVDFNGRLEEKDLMMMLSSVLFILIYFSAVVKSFALLVQSNATASSV